MKTFLCVSLASLLACVTVLAATDVSGRWASAPVYLILKQDGNKLSGTGGPTETQQMVTFDSYASPVFQILVLFYLLVPV